MRLPFHAAYAKTGGNDAREAAAREGDVATKAAVHPRAMVPLRALPTRLWLRAFWSCAVSLLKRVTSSAESSRSKNASSCVSRLLRVRSLILQAMPSPAEVRSLVLATLIPLCANATPNRAAAIASGEYSDKSPRYAATSVAGIREAAVVSLMAATEEASSDRSSINPSARGKTRERPAEMLLRTMPAPSLRRSSHASAAIRLAAVSVRGKSRVSSFFLASRLSFPCVFPLLLLPVKSSTLRAESVCSISS
mmetsp:Transcript_84998/g.170098  ORF Transcript_84998/g.170098 Transcript_84998/m.170098 type:complete len:251 (+) Transcript_84998:777-1529(+)